MRCCDVMLWRARGNGKFGGGRVGSQVKRRGDRERWA